MDSIKIKNLFLVFQVLAV